MTQFTSQPTTGHYSVYTHPSNGPPTTMVVMQTAVGHLRAKAANISGGKVTLLAVRRFAEGRTENTQTDTHTTVASRRT